MLKKMKFGINSKGCSVCEPGTRILVLIASTSSEGSDEPAHTRSLVRAFASRIQKVQPDLVNSKPSGLGVFISNYR